MIDDSNLIYVDLDSYRGDYIDIEFDKTYRITSANNEVCGYYQFKKDHSGDKCKNCALRDHETLCRTCFECYDASAKVVQEEVPVNRIVIDHQPEESASANPWEDDLRKVEFDISQLEEEIKRKQDDLKDCKKSLAELNERMRQIIYMGSAKYLETHPLFEGILN